MVISKRKILVLTNIDSFLTALFVSYLSVFLITQVISMMNNIEISLVTTLTSVTTIVSQQISNSKSFRQLFISDINCYIIFIALYGSNLLVLICNINNLTGLYILWSVLLPLTGNAIMGIFHDRTFSIFEGEELIQRNKQMMNACSLGGICGALLAGLIPIPIATTLIVLGISIVIEIIASSVMIYCYNKYMVNNKLILCHKKR